MPRTLPDFTLERLGVGPVAGIDEAGRGPLAGPVVAAAVILDPARLPAGIADSKILSAKVRAHLHDEIRAVALVGVGQASRAEIDELNILWATMLAMQRALAALPARPARALIDGNRCPVLPCPAEAVVKGDGRSLSIAAASIVAKVTRDRIMAALDGECPGYGWCRNQGYGTAEHLAALAELGPSAHHRRSFAPVARLLAGTALDTEHQILCPTSPE
ncbi:ribonuclease HII [Oceanibacterium hippocampi]|uniref:Ribonuclease HII n=1 Tax=Oceanibacterium hippocampi TaxID=745714 RepID=A0A1Y5S9C2_9PROT|nr:ribonuclease HII [Oceanibacterium hippocampi]SLN33981.1 Ribonuclease HII [Oceanibacterium hippocampi]